MKLGFKFRKKGRKPSKRAIQYIVAMLIMLLAAVAFSQEHLRNVLFSQKPHDFSGLGDEAPQLDDSGAKTYAAKARRPAVEGSAPSLDQGGFFTAPLEYQPEESAPAPPKRKVMASQEVYTPVLLPSQRWNIPPDDYSPTYSIPPVYNRVESKVVKLSNIALGSYPVVVTGGSNSGGSSSDDSSSGGSENEDSGGSGSDDSGSGGLSGGIGGGTGQSGGSGDVPIPPAVYFLGVGFAVVARRMRGSR